MGLIYDLDGRLIRLIDKDDRIVLHMQKGGYERETLSAWKQMVMPCRVALDIGAYTGLFSIIAAANGAHAVAFEPMPANRWRIGVNAALNKVVIDVRPLALSDRIGPLKLNYNLKVPLTTGASLETGIALHNASILVECTTLDRLAFTNVAAIKIDVERHELSVLRGAMQTIERDRPAMLIETLDEGMRIQVMRLLPRYSIAAVLDARNTLFVPQ